MLGDFAGLPRLANALFEGRDLPVTLDWRSLLAAVSQAVFDCRRGRWIRRFLASRPGARHGKAVTPDKPRATFCERRSWRAHNDRVNATKWQAGVIPETGSHRKVLSPILAIADHTRQAAPPSPGYACPMILHGLSRPDF